MKNTHSVIVLVSSLLAFWATSSFGVQPPTKRALLIGISNYEHLPDLRGADNDVDLIATVLTGKFGFLPNNIKTIKNSDATSEAIANAFEELASEVEPNDAVYIHFSGYGSEVVDVSGDSVTGYDATLIPHDGSGVPSQPCDVRGDGHVVAVVDPQRRIAWGSHGWDGTPNIDKKLKLEPDTGVE